MTSEFRASVANEAKWASGASAANRATGANGAGGANGADRAYGATQAYGADRAQGPEATNEASATDAAERERVLRHALESRGQRYTEQRAAVYRYLAGKRTHPTADEVFTAVRAEIPDISLATGYKSLEALVGCELAMKLTYGDAAARYDARTDPHPHARCTVCGSVYDVPGRLDARLLDTLGALRDFTVEGYRLEVIGRCGNCFGTV